MGMVFGGCDCDGDEKSRAELKVSWVSRRVDCRLSPLFLGGNWGKGGCRGGMGGAVGVSCEFSDWGDSVSIVWAVAARKVF